jgi:adenylate cyclase
MHTPNPMLEVSSGIAVDTPRNLRLVMVVDLMESVRLIQQFEKTTIERWIQFAEYAQQTLLPNYNARCVKSLGDGMLLELRAIPNCAQLAIDLHAYFAALNSKLPSEEQMWLRIGCHWCEVFQGKQDIYGAGVNLTARIAGYAGPGETMVSVEVCDELIDGIDAQLTDMGECYLKHIEQPVRIYKLNGVPATASENSFIQTIGQTNTSLTPPNANDSITPKIAVIPFEQRDKGDENLAIGDLIADGVIAMLSRTPQLHVVSRLSATRLRNRALSTTEKAHHLQANYLLSGSYYAVDGKIMVQAELVQVKDERIIWTDRLRTHLADLFELESELCGQIAVQVHETLLNFEVQNALTKPLPNLQSYSLLLGGLHLIHQASPASFDKGHEVLQHLVERHPRSAQAHTWNATLRMLRVTRGLTQDTKKEAALALRHTYQALEVEPQNALALATEGIVTCQLRDDPEIAHLRLREAVGLDPNCAPAWLYLATVQSLRGNTADAVVCGAQAVKLSPVDPQAYFYDSLYGASLLFDGQSEKAEQILERSLQRNCYHAPTVRTLIVAKVECGDIFGAQKLLTHLLKIEPELTAEKYLKRSKANAQTKQRFTSALLSAGLPLR